MTARSRARSVAIAAAAALVAAVPAISAGPALGDDGPEQIVNGTFDGPAGWEGYPAATFAGQGCDTVPAGTGAYAAAIKQSGVTMLPGETYELSYRASSTADGYLRVVVQGGPEVNYAAALPSAKLDLTPTLTAYSTTFTVPATASFPQGTTLEFSQDIGNDVAYTFCLDDVSLRGGAAPPVYTPQVGPRVKVDQEAYLPAGPKGATLVTDATTPLPWQLHDAAGATVASGTTTPRGVDPTAGENVQTIDFSAYRTPGTDLTLVADGETSHAFDIGSAAFERLRDDAMTFFYTNRSGIAIDDSLEPGYGRAAGHVGVSPNLGDTAVPCQALGDDSQKLLVAQGDQPWTCDYTTDVTGGWYDAGDHGKYVVNGGIAVAQLMQQFERQKNAASADGALTDASLRIPEAGNKVPDVLDEARWELEFFLRMQVPAGRPLAGMAYHKVADTDWTGLPLDPAADPQPRVLYRPSTAATLNLAATAAQGARLFSPYDKAFAARLLAASRTAYAAAAAHPALYAPTADATLDPNPGSGPYDDHDVRDEFYWAATELYLTTGEKAYAAAVAASPWASADPFTPSGFDWFNLAGLARLDLATVPNKLPGRAAARTSVLRAADRYLADQASQPFGQAYAPDGGLYTWGSNSNQLNNMQVIGTAYDLTGAATYREGVERGMDYLLGRNALGQSYITGYGDQDSHNQHTRLYAHELDARLPNPPAGSIAGGPNSTTTTTGDPVTGSILAGCPAQFCYIDEIGAYSVNEITVNWNAPLAWVASFVADQDDGGATATRACHVIYRNQDSYPGGFLATVTVQNTGSTPIRGWAVSWSFVGDQRVGSTDSVDTRQTGATVTATNRWYNTTIPAHGQRSFRLLGKSAGGANPAPELFRVNGLPCA